MYIYFLLFLVLIPPHGGVWKTLNINGKKWLLANKTSNVRNYDKDQPSLFFVFDNKTVAENTSLFIPNQIPGINDDEVDYDTEDLASEELLVRDILNNLQLLKEQEKLALLGPENDVDLQRIDDSVRVILVDKVKNKGMMQQIAGLEDGEMILMDDDYGSQNALISNVHARHNKFGAKLNQPRTKTYNVVVRRKPRRTQRVKLQRGHGNKVQKVYITY